MKPKFDVAAIALAGMFLVTSCLKDNPKSVNQDNKEVKVVRRDFTKGIMSIEYADGTKDISKIPIDSSAFQSMGKDSKFTGTKEWSEESEVVTPI